MNTKITYSNSRTSRNTFRLLIAFVLDDSFNPWATKLFCDIGYQGVGGYQLPLNFVIIFICPIAIAYSMGQIMKSVCVCVCVSVCPSASTLTVAFRDRFSPKLAQT